MEQDSVRKTYKHKVMPTPTHEQALEAVLLQDVRAYLVHSTGLGKIETTSRMVVTRVIFLTIRDLDRLTNDTEWEANYPPNLLICDVGLSGTFSVSAPSVIGGASTGTSSTASIVFDAHTGKGLAAGTPDELAGRL